MKTFKVMLNQQGEDTLVGYLGAEITAINKQLNYQKLGGTL